MKINFKDITVTDNTKEYNENIYFLKTSQNSKYVDKNIKNFITPKELIKILSLEDIKIIGVTGTNGKTTTSAAIYSLLIDSGKKCALQGTRGFFINDEKIEDKSLTTPSILNTIKHLYQAKKRDCEYFVMEVSSHAIEQNRIEDLNFSLKIHTNITQDHLDYHKTFKNYVDIKNSFFLDDSKKLINKDDPLIKFNYKNAYSYGLDNPSTFQILAYSLENGISAAIKFADEIADFHSPLIGLFNVYNLAAAVSAVKILENMPLNEICENVENFAGVSGRMEVINYEPLIIIDFAHTPDGMKKVFESFPGKDLVCVFGAGGDRDRDKRAKMGDIASRFCKKIYITSDNPRSEKPIDIINDIYQGVVDKNKAELIEDRKEAIKKAIKNLKSDEILLILGKGDETYQEINGKKIPFDDREIVRESLVISH
ncbi:UDP-N-acetylmuramoyl-L-alanyl-D-glutamate--2,6-diaminopimelate ligase [Nitrosophilus kaiyonis]|uniref:UDP-N-acetylmuramoyl-L-alanyl-D-glutamate--2, 6-diaminopimelate ligase n=1 Tax=Nitrosophilus kaiyonis TaxID=2930200 RepID=UPI0024903F1F|nr:UDP-N-acetylmuramoyl-L-alanyl-D-glutamate--2,6-diaminopimelate ligase [Nitrosophilus kaiyonis]